MTLSDADAKPAMTLSGYEIRTFGGQPMRADEARDVARLHEALLAHSPLVLMGTEFMEEFYYKLLPEEGFIHGAIAYVRGEAAGFVVVTADPAEFMSNALAKYRARIAWIVMRSVIKHPSRLLAMKEAYQVQSSVQAQDYGPRVGELLSFGVKPEFRSRQFVRDSGVFVGTDLMAAALSRLARLDVTRARAIVDKDNLEAQLFYRSQGWQVGLKTVQGWRVPTMEFLKELDDSSQRHCPGGG